MQNDQQRKINIAVLLGGDSNEREISLESGRNIVYKLSPSKYHVIPIFVSGDRKLYRIDDRMLVQNTTKEMSGSVSEAMRVTLSDLPSLVDFVFIALHGGIGENGCIQGALEMLGIPYNGSSVFASALCMNKYKTNCFLREQGFEVPRHVLIAREDWTLDKDKILKNIQDEQVPLIVKPHDDGCSVMVSKATNDEQLSQAIEALFAAGKSHAFIEECVQGMELTVGVVGNEHPIALPPSQALASAGILSIEEKFLPGAGENQTPAPLPTEALAYVQKTVAAAYKAIGCKGYARIDCFYQSSEQSPTGSPRVIILEINTLPGVTPATVLFHQAAELGIRPMEFVDMIVELGFAAHEKQAMKQESRREQDILRPLTTSDDALPSKQLISHSL